MRFYTVFLVLIFTFSCESDSISDVSGLLNEDLTLYELPWQNTSVSTNQQLTVQVGDTVRWIWGSGTHNLRSTSGIENFDSGFISEQGYQFQWIFNQIGSTQYVCDPHPNSMFGTITVTE
jgi:hypothetical protein